MQLVPSVKHQHRVSSNACAYNNATAQRHSLFPEVPLCRGGDAQSGTAAFDGKASKRRASKPTGFKKNI